jgi:hypothetical protein
MKKPLNNLHIHPKYSEEEYCFFSNLKIYKELNPTSISEIDKCDLNGIIACLGLDYTNFLFDQPKAQLAI